MPLRDSREQQLVGKPAIVAVRTKTSVPSSEISEKKPSSSRQQVKPEKKHSLTSPSAVESTPEILSRGVELLLAIDTARHQLVVLRLEFGMAPMYGEII